MTIENVCRRTAFVQASAVADQNVLYHGPPEAGTDIGTLVVQGIDKSKRKN